jgi:hypothetical protein
VTTVNTRGESVTVRQAMTFEIGAFTNSTTRRVRAAASSSPGLRVQNIFAGDAVGAALGDDADILVFPKTLQQRFLRCCGVVAIGQMERPLPDAWGKTYEVRPDVPVEFYHPKHRPLHFTNFVRAMNEMNVDDGAAGGVGGGDEHESPFASSWGGRRVPPPRVCVARRCESNGRRIAGEAGARAARPHGAMRLFKRVMLPPHPGCRIPSRGPTAGCCSNRDHPRVPYILYALSPFPCRGPSASPARARVPSLCSLLPVDIARCCRP